MSLTLELVTFRVREAYEANFVIANTVVNDWLAGQPGYISRNLSRTPDGEWIDAILWLSNTDAWIAAEKIMKEIGECEAMCAIDSETIVMRYAASALVHTAADAAPRSDAA